MLISELEVEFAASSSLIPTELRDELQMFWLAQPFKLWPEVSEKNQKITQSLNAGCGVLMSPVSIVFYSRILHCRISKVDSHSNMNI